MKERKNRNITIYLFIFAFCVVNTVLCFSYHHYNFRTLTKLFRSIQKIMTVTTDAYRHVKITFDHYVIKAINQELYV